MNCIIRCILLFLCTIPTTFAAAEFLTLSDIHYGNGNIAKEGGDTGDEFLAITLNKMRDLSKEVDFIINLGDIPTHSFFNTDKKEQFEQEVFHGLFKANQAVKPMFYITGNNDSLSGNYQPFEVDGKSPLNFAVDWTGACSSCNGLIIDDSHMQHDGYYSSYVIPGNKKIILIALNTVQWTKTPVYAPQYPNQAQDAMRQLQWLEGQLQKNQAQQLLIAMHIPPGLSYDGHSFWGETYLEQFIALLEKYHRSFAQITLLTSHTHMEEFRTIKLRDGTNIFAYSTPGISRNHYNNPGMKRFTLDEQFKVKDFITYYTTQLDAWGDETFHALGIPDAIFPDCKNITLAQCLAMYSEAQVCTHLEQGMFYSVKSSRVPNQGCINTYRIN